MDTSSIKITICSIAYRDKRIVETLSNAIKLSDSPGNISTSILIQDSYHHEINFEKNILNNKIFYNSWHNFNGFAKERNNLINLIDDESYILFINPGTEFTQSWDTKLNNFVKINDNALSTNNNIFSFSGTFIKKENFNYIKYPTYLKHLGQEEDISIKFYCSDIKIISGIEEIIKPATLRLWDYIPFSSSHKYYEVENLYKNGYNSYSQINEKYQEYSKKYPIKHMPDQIEDPPYSLSDLYINRSPYDVFNNTTNKI